MIEAPAVWSQNARHALEGRHRSFCPVAFACSRSNLIANGLRDMLDITDYTDQTTHRSSRLESEPIARDPRAGRVESPWAIAAVYYCSTSFLSADITL